MAHLATAVRMLALMTLLTGFVYPLAMTGLSQVIFPRQANGSLIEGEDGPLGSSLIGQPFDDPAYFWPRPSATAPEYNAAASTGSNWGPLHADLVGRVADRVVALSASGSAGRVPIDLVTTSGSGLDPHITPAGAMYQVPRVAASRHLDETVVRNLVERYREPRQLGVLGEPRVNVLELNLALDRLPPGP